MQGHRLRRSATLIGASTTLIIGSLAMGAAPAIASQGSSAASLPGTIPESVLSHVLCYRGKMRGFPTRSVGITLTSPALGTYPAGVRAGQRLCNPVRKQKGGKILAPIVSKRQHLKVYALNPQIAPGEFEGTVINQFGNVAVKFERQPTRLMVPTRKFPHKFPNGLAHFVCHDVISGSQPTLRFKLRDQFRQYKKMSVDGPERVCIPATKQHRGKVFAPKHPDVYLVCYSVSDRRIKRKRLTSNQFEKRRTVVAKRTAELCVPSRMGTV